MPWDQVDISCDLQMTNVCFFWNCILSYCNQSDYIRALRRHNLSDYTDTRFSETVKCDMSACEFLLNYLSSQLQIRDKMWSSWCCDRWKETDIHSLPGKKFILFSYKKTSTPSDRPFECISLWILTGFSLYMVC